MRAYVYVFSLVVNAMFFDASREVLWLLLFLSILVTAEEEEEKEELKFFFEKKNRRLRRQEIVIWHILECPLLLFRSFVRSLSLSFSAYHAQVI